MDQLTDAQLDALFKAGNAESLPAALQAVYQAGINWGWANPPVTVIDVPAPVADPVTPPADAPVV